MPWTWQALLHLCTLTSVLVSDLAQANTTPAPSDGSGCKEFKCGAPCSDLVDFQRSKMDTDGCYFCYCVSIPISAGSCFPDHATTRLDDGREATLASLRPGDRVLAVTQGTQLVSSEVLLLLHRDPEKEIEYVHVWTENSSLPLVVSPDHLVFTHSGSGLLAMPAAKVSFGHVMYTYDVAKGEIERRKVVKVNWRKRKSVIAPLTAHGTMVVNDVIVSCYSLYHDHDVSHMMYAPIRLLHSLGAWRLLTNGEDMSKQVGVHWTAQVILRSLCFLYKFEFCLTDLLDSNPLRYRQMS